MAAGGCVANAADDLGVLGKGTYGKVYKVRDEGKTYALKTFISGSYLAGNVVEIDTLTRVNHPNVVKAHKIYVNSECNVCLMLDLADGDLDKYIKESVSPNRPTDQQYQIMHGLLCGLNYLHSNYIVHNDLKPANILMTKGVPKIADFGLASITHTPVIPYTQTLVTLWWRAPELLVCDLAEKGVKCTYTNASDIWSMGLIFFELVTGKKLIASRDEEDTLMQIVTKIGPLTASQIDTVNPSIQINANTGSLVDVLKSYASGKEAESRYKTNFGGIPYDILSLILPMINTDPSKRPDASVLSRMPLFEAYNTPEKQCKSSMTDPRAFDIELKPRYAASRTKVLQYLYDEFDPRPAFPLAVDMMDRLFSKKTKTLLGDMYEYAAAVFYLSVCMYDSALAPELNDREEKNVCEVAEALHFKFFRPTVDLNAPKIISKDRIYRCMIDHHVPTMIIECSKSAQSHIQEVLRNLSKELYAFRRTAVGVEQKKKAAAGLYTYLTSTGLSIEDLIVVLAHTDNGIRDGIDEMLEVGSTSAEAADYVLKVPSGAKFFSGTK